MKIIGFGAVLWDDIKDKQVGSHGDPDNSVCGEQNIGGAVFNVVAHARKLGFQAYMASAIGDDLLGQKTLDAIRSLDVKTDFIKTVAEPTCVVAVSLDKDGLPTYSIPEVSSWDAITVNKNDLRLIDNIYFDYFCFGTLEQRNRVSRETLQEILTNCRFKNVYVDLTLRRQYTKEIIDYSLQHSSIAKMNDEEADVVNELFGFGSKSYENFINRISIEFDIDTVCITTGSAGAHIGSRKEYEFCSGYRVAVSDTVGAGDAFSAGMLHKLSTGANLKDVCDFANKMGALISAKKSSIPEYDIADIGRIGSARAAEY